MIKETWFQLVFGGVLMILISALTFGGFLYALVTSPGSWVYLSFLAFAGTASVITGILMIFDASQQRMKKKFTPPDEDTPTSNGEMKQEERKKMNALIERAERLKPETLKRKTG